MIHEAIAGIESLLAREIVMECHLPLKNAIALISFQFDSIRKIQLKLPSGPWTMIFLADGTFAVSKIDASHCSLRRICFKSLNMIPCTL